MLQLSNSASSGPEIFDESLMFKDAYALELKEDFKNRFRNVSRLMDCVGCDKCRLWGKVQTQGYGTALKVLFEFDENKGVDDNPPLRRTELVALVNTLDRLSTSLFAAVKFQQLWEQRNVFNEQKEEEEGIKVHNSYNKLPPKNDGTPKQEMSIGATLLEEIEVVWEAMKFIMMSWFQLPGAVSVL